MRQIYYRVCLFLGIYKREDFVTAWYVVNTAYNRYKKIPAFAWGGLCQTFRNSLRDVAGIIVSYEDIHKYIPKFNPKFLGAEVNKRKSPFWWPDLVTSTNAKQAYYLRLEALKKLQEYYFYERTILIKKGKYL